MTTLIGKKSGYFIHEIPIEPVQYTKAILTYGNILDSKNRETLEVPLSHIKKIKPSMDEYHTLEVEWADNEEYGTNYFNEVHFE